MLYPTELRARATFIVADPLHASARRERFRTLPATAAYLSGIAVGARSVTPFFTTLTLTFLSGLTPSGRV